MKLRASFFRTIATIAALTAASSAAPLKIELPPEGGSFKKAPGAELAMAQCLICHSAEYVSTQPPFSRAAWKTSVEKMQKKFGAPIPADQVDALVDYIVKNYGTEGNAAAGKTVPSK